MNRLFSRTIRKSISNIPGWKTKRKLIIIESDDWGSLRMPSRLVYEKLKNKGLDLQSADAERYNLNDNLATSEDLASLYEVLSDVKDSNGKNAVFTPVCIMANPKFEEIALSEFKSYSYEPFTDTLKRFKGCENAFDLWKEGIEKRLFVPQMHGREHLNVLTWMKALQAGEKKTLQAFNEGIWGFVPDSYPIEDYQAAFLIANENDVSLYKQVIKDGLALFEQLLGYKAEYFVPPNGQFNNALNITLFENGIKYRSAARVQVESLGAGKKRKVYHYHGQKDKSGIKYITRNCLFEPGQNKNDWVDNCLYDIKAAFRWGKPAIISSHRVNYIGAINKKNRDNGLTQLKDLLSRIVKKWPDVEFITTSELGLIMEG